MIQDRRAGFKRHWWEPNGRRGAFLITLGLMHIVVGFYIATAPQGSFTADRLEFLAAWGVPFHAACVLWWVSGACGIVAAFLVPPGHDGWGFQVLTATQAAWAVVYVTGAIMQGDIRGALLALVFALSAVAVLIVVGMVSARTALRSRPRVQ